MLNLIAQCVNDTRIEEIVASHLTVIQLSIQNQHENHKVIKVNL